MKKFVYKLLQGVMEDGTPILITKEKEYSESGEAIAKAEAYKGEYTIEDDGEEEPGPTTEERVAEMEETLKKILSLLAKLGVLSEESE